MANSRMRKVAATALSLPTAAAIVLTASPAMAQTADAEMSTLTINTKGLDSGAELTLVNSQGDEIEKKSVEGSKVDFQFDGNDPLNEVLSVEVDGESYLTVGGECVGIVGASVVNDDNETPDTPAPGDETPGDETPGDETPGDENSGDENSGDENSGDENSGDENSGDENSGDETQDDETQKDPPVNDGADPTDPPTTLSYDGAKISVDSSGDVKYLGVDPMALEAMAGESGLDTGFLSGLLSGDGEGLLGGLGDTLGGLLQGLQPIIGIVEKVMDMPVIGDSLRALASSYGIPIDMILDAAKSIAGGDTTVDEAVSDLEDIADPNADGGTNPVNDSDQVIDDAEQNIEDDIVEKNLNLSVTDTAFEISPANEADIITCSFEYEAVDNGDDDSSDTTTPAPSGNNNPAPAPAPVNAAPVAAPDYGPKVDTGGEVEKGFLAKVASFFK